ncbi:hypothetical protein Nepgr_009874 [Nepenthes gracilis]|uniref:acid phosphatase n=1 Tax=Nepenthes gracilis TaxID=150966 RepID=A0AAD3SC30_NEPGR|nr:hypothetical protein Nepgr_009874 [Nepenthes gracilis]
MPASGPSSYSERIAIVGDLGVTYNMSSTIRHLMINKPDLVLVIYAAPGVQNSNDGGGIHFLMLGAYIAYEKSSDQYKWLERDLAKADRKVTPWLAATWHPPWYSTYRAHYGEVECVRVAMEELLYSYGVDIVFNGNFVVFPSLWECKEFVPIHEHLIAPAVNKKSPSFLVHVGAKNAEDDGGIHFLMLGAYIAYEKSSDQYKWLERDLAKADRKVTPWLAATWHPPWYSTYRAHYGEVECMRVAMEELLYSYGVDIVFNGNVHIFVGDGGNREKMAIPHADDPGNCPDPLTIPDPYIDQFCAFNFTSGPGAGKFCWDRQPDYSALRETSFGHGILKVKNETHALWTWHRNQDMYNTAGDEIYIVRQPECCPVSRNQLLQNEWHLSYFLLNDGEG